MGFVPGLGTVLAPQEVLELVVDLVAEKRCEAGVSGSECRGDCLGRENV